MTTATVNETDSKTELKIVEDATCTFCGCVCDDIILKVEGDRITEAKNACVLGTRGSLATTKPMILHA